MSALYAVEFILFAAFVAVVFLATDHHLDAPKEWNHPAQRLTSELLDRMKSGRRVRRAAFVVLGAALAAATCVGMVRPVAAMLLPLVWLSWTASTAVWSRDRPLSLRRLAPLSVTLAAGLAAGAWLGWTAVALLIGLVSALYLCLGVLNELVRGRRTMRRVQRFAGTLHPNQQGVICALLALSAAYLGVAQILPPALIIPATAVAGVALLSTRSRSAIWATAAAACAWALSACGAQPAAWLASTIAAAAAVAAASPRVRLAMRRVLFLGRETRTTASLGGRIELWRHVWAQTRGYRTVGVGHGAFWDRARVQEITQLTGWRFSDCHNSYLETMVGSGIVGLALHACTLATALGSALLTSGPHGPFATAFFVFVAVQGMIESTFVVPSFFAFACAMMLGAPGDATGEPSLVRALAHYVVHQ